MCSNQFEFDLLADGFLRRTHVATDIAVANIDKDVGGQQRIFGANAWGALVSAICASWPNGTMAPDGVGDQNLRRNPSGSLRNSRG